MKAEEGSGLTFHEMPKVSFEPQNRDRTHPELSQERDTCTEKWLWWVLRARRYLSL